MSLLTCRCILAAVALSLLTLLKVVGGDKPPAASSPRPAPSWLRVADLGDRSPLLKGYFAPAELSVEIAAQAPAVVNPMGLTFADDGSLFVLQWLPDETLAPPAETEQVITYKDGTSRRFPAAGKRAIDQVRLLVDTDKDGTYDTSHVVLSGLALPGGILAHDGYLYVAAGGQVVRYRLASLTTLPDVPKPVSEVVVRGFSAYPRRQVSGLAVGNDGWLYITAGDDDNIVEGSDAGRAAVLRCGAVFRCRPDGSKVQLFAVGLSNPYGPPAFDAAGNLFHVDDDDEQDPRFVGCRLLHLVEDADFGWRRKAGARPGVPDPGQTALFGELPGRMPPLLRLGRGVPAGLCIYNDAALPEHYRGVLFQPDPLNKRVRAFIVRPKGASFEVTHEFDLLKSDDPLFRPSHVTIGPDGAIYVADWRTHAHPDGKLWGDGRSGRIYRIHAGRRRPLDSWAKVLKQNDQELLGTLAADHFSDRLQARYELAKRGEKNRDALLKILKDRDESLPKRIAAWGAVQEMWNEHVGRAMASLLADEREMARLAAQAIAEHAPRGNAAAQENLDRAFNHEEAAVLRAFLLAMGRIGAPSAAESITNFLKFEKSDDPWLVDAYARALDRLGKPGMDALLALGDSGRAGDLRRVVETFAAARSPAAADALPTLLKNVNLTAADRLVLVRSFHNHALHAAVAPPRLVQAAAYARGSPDLILAGLEYLAAAPTLPQKDAAALLLDLVHHPDEAVAQTAVRVLARLSAPADFAPLLAGLLKDGLVKGPAVQRAAIEVLGEMRHPFARTVLARLAEEEKDAALRNAALRSLFQVDAAAAEELSRTFLDRQDAPVLAEAVRIVVGRPDGPDRAAKLFLAGKLPNEVLPDLAEALRRRVENSPALQPVLVDVLKAGLGEAGSAAAAARVRKLVDSRGDAQRGRLLFLDAQRAGCIRCHAIDGVGGRVGPDLTSLRDRSTPHGILLSLIDADAAVTPPYQTLLVKTSSGGTHRGVKVSQDKKALVLRLADGTNLTIPAADVAQAVAERSSLMPHDIPIKLRFEELLDLTAFLSGDKPRAHPRGQVGEAWVFGPLARDAGVETAIEADPDAAKRTGVPLGNAAARNWTRIWADPAGRLNLAHGPLRLDHIAYAFCYVHSPREQAVELELSVDASTKIWLDGKVVFEDQRQREACPDADRIRVGLKAGWNRLLVKTTSGTVSGRHGFALRLEGEGLRIASVAE